VPQTEVKDSGDRPREPVDRRRVQLDSKSRHTELLAVAQRTSSPVYYSATRPGRTVDIGEGKLETHHLDELEMQSAKTACKGALMEMVGTRDDRVSGLGN
jgi:hypothetical protein